MSNCKYYTCFKRNPACKHPTVGKYKTEVFQKGSGGMWNPCNLCRMSCGGLYPSQLPDLEAEKRIAIIEL